MVRAWHGFAPLDGNRSVDACVVGLGASGIAAVEAFVAQGASVIGIDAGRVAAGASGRNGGFLLAGPAMPLHEAIGRWGEHDAVGLQRETMDEIDRLIERLGPDVVRRVGSLRIAGHPDAPDELELADCHQLSQAMQTHGFAVEPYDGELGKGLFLPQDAAMNPARRTLATAQLVADAQLYEHTPALQVTAHKVTTPAGTIIARHIVVAVDGRLDAIFPNEVFPNLTIRTARLQMLATTPVALRLPCPVYMNHGFDYAQQDRDGRLFVGGGRQLFTDDEWTHETSPTADVQHYLETLARRLSDQPIEVAHRWAASVGFTDDKRPLCVEVADGVMAVGGYSGTGNLVGPIAARAAVAWLTNKTPRPTYLAT